MDKPEQGHPTAERPPSGGCTAADGDRFNGRTITRAAPRERYTVVHNHPIEDDRLSYRALGLLVYLLSKPDNWKTHVNQLVKAHTEGRDAVRASLGNLEDAGYITRRWLRMEGDATPTMHYFVSELPAALETRNPDNPAALEIGNPDFQRPGNPQLVSTDLEVSTEKSVKTEGGAKRRRPLPEPFVLSDSLKAWAVEHVPTIDSTRETAQFIDHYRAQASTRADWDAAWRKWMRDARPRPGGAPLAKVDQRTLDTLAWAARRGEATR